MHGRVSGDHARVAAAIQDLLDRAPRAPHPASDPEFIAEYDRRRIAQQIAAFFDSAVDLRKSPQRQP